MFGQVGTLEIVVVLIIALIVLGPKRLPEVARSVGKGVREMRDAMSGEGDDDDDDDDDDDEKRARIASEKRPGSLT